MGSTTPYGWGFSGGNNGLEIFTNVTSTYLKGINCTYIVNGGGEMADTGPLAAFGIPLVRNEVWV